jgi:CheY-like chemotaxis protein
MGGDVVASPDGAVIDLRNRRILLVDDDSGIRLLLTTYLRSRGFQLLEACDGREALTAMRAGGVDLVIMDLMMPVVSGMDVLRERADDPALLKIPVIIISANNKCEESAEIVDQSVWAVVSKPFDLETLLTTVRTCLEHFHVPSPAFAA